MVFFCWESIQTYHKYETDLGANQVPIKKELGALYQLITLINSFSSENPPEKLMAVSINARCE